MRKIKEPSLRFEARAYDPIGPLWVALIEVTRRRITVPLGQNSVKCFYWQPKGDLSAIEACRFLGRKLRCTVHPY